MTSHVPSRPAKLEAIALRLEAIARRVEAFASPNLIYCMSFELKSSAPHFCEFHPPTFQEHAELKRPRSYAHKISQVVWCHLAQTIHVMLVIGIYIYNYSYMDGLARVM